MVLVSILPRRTGGPSSAAVSCGPSDGTGVFAAASSLRADQISSAAIMPITPNCQPEERADRLDDIDQSQIIQDVDDQDEEQKRSENPAERVTEHGSLHAAWSAAGRARFMPVDSPADSLRLSQDRAIQSCVFFTRRTIVNVGRAG